MNPAAILALITDLYLRISALTDENERLRQAVRQSQQEEPASTLNH